MNDCANRIEEDSACSSWKKLVDEFAMHREEFDESLKLLSSIFSSMNDRLEKIEKWISENAVSKK